MTPDDIKAEASPANMPIPIMVPLNFIAVLLRSRRFVQLEDSAPTWVFGTSATPIATEETGGGEPPPEFFLLHDVRQQAEETGALDRLGEFTLLLLADSRDTGRNDLATFRNVTLQKLDVLVVDLRCVCAGERARLATAMERTTGRDLIDINHDYAPSPASLSRGRRGPRSPRSPRSKPPSRRRGRSSPSRSRRSSRRVSMADWPSSCSSTRTVRKRRTSSLIRIWRSISATAAAGASMFTSV